MKHGDMTCPNIVDGVDDDDLFVCAGCSAQCCKCCGAADSYFELCDDCAVKAMKEDSDGVHDHSGDRSSPDGA